MKRFSEALDAMLWDGRLDGAQRALSLIVVAIGVIYFVGHALLALGAR